MNQKMLENFLEEYNDKYEIVTIGRSVLGNKIYAVNCVNGKNYKWVLITAGIHAREHLSCDLVCKFIESAYETKLSFNISFVPLVNPDGANLCVDGIATLAEKDRKRLVKINKSEDFSLYKANARGVDLNNNWNANWEEKFTKITSPAPQGFYGYKPMSEPEVNALEGWAESLDLFLSISYHLKGEEIYFDFFQSDIFRKRDEKIANVFAKSSGYRVKETESVSSGGFKDWCVQKLKIPALTIELGDDKFSHPYPNEEIDNIYEKNKNLFKNLKKCLKITKKYQKIIKKQKK